MMKKKKILLTLIISNIFFILLFLSFMVSFIIISDVDKKLNYYTFTLDESSEFEIVDPPMVHFYGVNCSEQEERMEIGEFDVGKFWASELDPNAELNSPKLNQWHDVSDSIIAHFNYGVKGNLTIYPNARSSVYNYFPVDTNYYMKTELISIQKAHGLREVPLISQSNTYYHTGNQYIPVHLDNPNSEMLKLSKGDGLSFRIQAGFRHDPTNPTPRDHIQRPSICSDSIHQGTYVSLRIDPFTLSAKIDNQDTSDPTFNYQMALYDSFNTFSNVRVSLTDQRSSLLLDSKIISTNNSHHFQFNTDIDFKKLSQLVSSNIVADNVFNINVQITENTLVGGEKVTYNFVRKAFFHVDYDEYTTSNTVLKILMGLSGTFSAGLFVATLSYYLTKRMMDLEKDP